MYNLDFSMVDVPLVELEAERDANIWTDFGESPY
jgi:hypothetical protein